jgi:hypothetical protein
MLNKGLKLFFHSLVTLCFVVVIVPVETLAQQGIDLNVAQSYFDEVRAICEKDDGKLWGRSLCGPIIFINPQTRMLVANQADAEGRLSRRGTLFVGRLPDEENCANTALTWAGVHWSMILWPALSEDKMERARLLIHESFHRIQETIGLPLSNPSNNHLDSLQGRLWLQLEWRALRQALAHQGSERRNALADALIFRLYRRTLFPQAASEERALEMNEGLAEYTGVKLSGRTDAELALFMAGRLERVNRPSFTRSFAYESGPAYGLLLDELKDGWRRNLKPSDDLGLLLQKALALRAPDNLKAEASRRAVKYDYEQLQATETKRENERLARLAQYRAKLVDGPVLIFPLTEKVNYSFNPNNLISLDSVGTIYPTLRITDAWGVLEVAGGALMILENNKPSRLYVPAPRDEKARPLQAEGWKLELKDGWTLEAAERKGDYLLKLK